ncbi:CPBP family intramembrane glutamic endopeptidase [Halorubrum sp. Atlit-26R]|uniref:CPBP family intramembrane glutamic endopeptidase n=1 Tax=Halorubrum sp. Atlit-26R TaxID=2282128 RepID=UPI000EF1F1C1|nr:CPBP family intramembrane glutamic endopeptidase [Halorubrum sp. Atlit-26R]RLM63399.1 CPBP family intramembrane metalloprotease [Halorubrum sp. Atlit-26R]
MVLADVDRPTFERGSAVPVATYLVALGVLSAFVFVSPGKSPPPILGIVWGIFLAALAICALYLEGVSPRSVLPSVRTFVPVIVLVVVFWGLYNLVAVGLALAGVVGFEATWSRVAAHPLAYLAALFSSLLFTAIPEELVFRAYLQQKFIEMAGGESRRAVGFGVVVAAVLFAVFHLPRWFLALEHGVGPALVVRLSGLTLAGLAFGTVYAVTGNLWLVAVFHATMNSRPVLVTVSVPPELHFVVGIIEYATITSVVYLSVYLTEPERMAFTRSRQENSS